MPLRIDLLGAPHDGQQRPGEAMTAAGSARRLSIVALEARLNIPDTSQLRRRCPVLKVAGDADHALGFVARA